MHIPGQIVHGDTMQKTADYLIETADQCSGLAREGRVLIERLEQLRNDLIAKAVELDTDRQKSEKQARSVD